MKSIAVFWDYQNVPVLEIADDILKFAKSKGKLIKAVVYDNWNQQNSPIKADLEAKGFRCINVKSKYTNAADFELMVDLGKELVKNSPDIIILITGDNYALTAIDKVQEEHKQIIVIAQLKSCNQQLLKKRADEFYTTEEIKKHPMTSPCLMYYEAINYLLQAIEYCLTKKKPTTLDRIASFMIHHSPVPNLTKPVPILKEDGTKITKFSNFVESVIKDGIIIQQNDQIAPLSLPGKKQ
jgi:uncharacterized LabA/DUF88 family protein